jgi:hypothetical protein
MVTVGFNHTCALDDTGVVCWGYNNQGQTNVPILDGPEEVWANGHSTCALDKNGTHCWGGDSISRSQLINDRVILTNYSIQNSSCSLDVSEGLQCSGLSDFGQFNSALLTIDPDGDGFHPGNVGDLFPLDKNDWFDSDNDGVGDNADNDNDNDGTQNVFDAFPFNASEQLDHDNDGIGNNHDTDDDGDGVADFIDTFPLDPNESADSDGDGVGDNADFFPNSAEYSLDSDLDQMPDAWERKYGLNPTDASDAAMDHDGDGLTALEEYEAGTIPLKILDIDANGSVDALTDGLMVLRYLFGLRGQGLISNGTASDAMRTEAADIEAYIQSLMPDF